MHILQPKHTKLNEKESRELLEKFNISKAQLPKILLSDPALPEGATVGDIIKIERKSSNLTKDLEDSKGKVSEYFRAVV